MLRKDNAIPNQTLEERLDPFKPGFQFATTEEWKAWLIKEQILAPLFDFLRQQMDANAA